jgi:hypothetical protein
MSIVMKQLLLIGLLLASCRVDKPKSEYELRKEEIIREELALDSIRRVDREQEIQWKIKNSDSLKSVAKKLAAKFIKTTDEFKGIDFYRYHKHWPNRKTVYAECSSEGYYYLRSNWYASDWLFHESISLLFEDGTILRSEEVSTLDKKNRQENEGGDVWENVTYNNSQDLVEMISRNKDKKIIVRFNGRQYYDDIVLTASDKNKIASIYELAKVFESML